MKSERQINGGSQPEWAGGDGGGDYGPDYNQVRSSTENKGIFNRTRRGVLNAMDRTFMGVVGLLMHREMNQWMKEPVKVEQKPLTLKEREKITKELTGYTVVVKGKP